MRFFLLIRTWIISIVLAGAAVFFGYQAFEVWSANETPAVKKPVAKPPKPQADRRVAYRPNPRYKTYAVIAQKNLFASDRREKLPAKAPTPSAVKPAKALDRRFALYGIVINGDQKKALVSNLDKKNAKKKEYIWVKVGDKIGTLNVSEIQSEQIILTQGGSTYTIRLSDQNHPRKRSIMRKKTKQTGTGTKSITIPKAKSPAAKGLKTSS
jgi:hypothetical protein